MRRVEFLAQIKESSFLGLKKQGGNGRNMVHVAAMRYCFDVVSVVVL